MDIKKMVLGITNSYLLTGDHGYIMVDTGIRNQQERFLSGLKYHHIKAEQIRLIIITHGHFDHVGSLAAIKGLCRNCQVMIHPYEAPRISEPRVAIPPGTNLEGKIISSIGRVSRPILKFEPVKPEILFKEEITLREYGIEGKVIHTPGHTAGSLTVLLDDGQAIVGDLAVNFTRSRPFPPFAEEPSVIYSSWKRLCEAGATTIYPAHGPSFPASWLKENLPAGV
ncbi:MAG TPA: MBL fold metallo-hydrolase [Syntrophomonadaceae bacterium]|jgi:glyoxylase-like metal-dependent hydrolase (beta-lactamase superfamily II)|nr:MBL fold metallo-hydrolase [Syntrophomonadaceae bacterium]HRX20962.1 MBL fold metallo-hydrolase [Syntrophomonadaceae bacterium]